MKVKLVKRDDKYYPLRIDEGKQVVLYCPWIQINTNCGTWCPLLEIRQGKFTELVLWKCGGNLQVAEVVEKEK
jgi:hypothetical protein